MKSSHFIYALLVIFCWSNNVFSASTTVSGRYLISQNIHGNHSRHGHEKPTAQEWIVWKDERQIEIQQKGAPYSVVLIKLNNGAYQRKEVHHAFKTVISYEPGDANTLGMTQNWKGLAALFDNSLINILDVRGKQQFDSFRGIAYEGSINGRHYNVLWLPESGIPALIEVEDHKGGERIILIERFDDSNSPKRPDWQLEYDDIDYADIGDNETHPLVQSMHHTSSNSQFYPGHNH